MKELEKEESIGEKLNRGIRVSLFVAIFFILTTITIFSIWADECFPGVSYIMPVYPFVSYWIASIMAVFFIGKAFACKMLDDRRIDDNGKNSIYPIMIAQWTVILGWVVAVAGYNKIRLFFVYSDQLEVWNNRWNWWEKIDCGHKIVMWIGIIMMVVGLLVWITKKIRKTKENKPE